MSARYASQLRRLARVPESGQPWLRGATSSEVLARASKKGVGFMRYPRFSTEARSHSHAPAPRGVETKRAGPARTVGRVRTARPHGRGPRSLAGVTRGHANLVRALSAGSDALAVTEQGHAASRRGHATGARAHRGGTSALAASTGGHSKGS